MEGNFALEKVIAKGAFGTVYKGKFENKPVAIKKIEIIKDSPEYKYLHSEIDIMKKLSHQNIVKLLKVSITKNTLYLITELIEGKDLKSYLELHKFIKKNDAKRLFKQVIEALIYIRDQKVIHRDIKPANILLTSDNIEEAQIKIIDFGLSTIRVSKMATTNVGSPLYSAPEVTEYLSYTYKVDTWSVGVLFYEAIYGIVPFWAYTIPELAKLQKRGPNYPYNANVDESVKELLKAMLEYNPDNRLEYEEILKLRFFKKEEKSEVELITPKPTIFFEKIETNPKKLLISEYLASINLFDYNTEGQIIDDSPEFLLCFDEETKDQPIEIPGNTRSESFINRGNANPYIINEETIEQIKKENKNKLFMLLNVVKELYEWDMKCLCLHLLEELNQEYCNFKKLIIDLMMNEGLEEYLQEKLDCYLAELDLEYTEETQLYNSFLLDHHSFDSNEFEKLSKTITEIKMYKKKNLGKNGNKDSKENKEKVKAVVECVNRKFPKEKVFKKIYKELHYN